MKALSKTMKQALVDRWCIHLATHEALFVRGLVVSDLRLAPHGHLTVYTFEHTATGTEQATRLEARGLIARPL